MERLEAAEGSAVELDRVLLIADGDKVTVGQPAIDGARVTATAQQHGREDKVIVFKYKSKVRYRRKNGHRQHFTRLAIGEILPPGATATAAKAKPASKPRRAKKEVTEDGA